MLGFSVVLPKSPKPQNPATPEPLSKRYQAAPVAAKAAIDALTRTLALEWGASVRNKRHGLELLLPLRLTVLKKGIVP